MRLFEHYELKQVDNEYTLIIYLNQSLELASEFDNQNEERNENFLKKVRIFIKGTFPNTKIKTVKIMMGALLISSFSPEAVFASESYKVQSGDNLWKIANQYGISISQLKNENHLTSDTIYVGQTLQIPNTTTENINVTVNGVSTQFNPPPVMLDGTTYLPLRPLAESLGATVWYNNESNTVGINREDIKIAFVLGSSFARVNGNQIATSESRIINNTTYVPVRFVSETFGLNVDWNSQTKTVRVSEPQKKTYTIVSGDNLWLIAKRFGTSVSAIKEVNNLTSDVIYVNQKLTIPTTTNITPQEYTEPTVTYINHRVVQGDNIWNLSIQYGIPMTELLKVNNLTQNSALSLGHEVRIPIHHIPVKPVVSARHGELLNWWTEAQYVFPIGEVAKVTDFKTGRTWNIKRTIGANHADSEPLTAQDAAIMKEVWGGSYSWSARAVILEIDGRRVSASISSMPHSIQYINNNNFNGHFDVHFLNSTRHKDGQITEEHQRQIKIAAGIS